MIKKFLTLFSTGEHFKIFIISRLFFVFSALVATLWLPQRIGYLGLNTQSFAPYLLWIWSNFDGQHYLRIAVIGYTNYDFAFFPFYSILIRFFSTILPLTKLYAGIAVSLLSFFFSMILIYKITELDFNKHIASATILFLAFFPVSFYYHSVYTDALFLLLSTASFYLARQHRWYLCGLAGALATLTRLSGLSLVPALVIEWYLQNKYSWKNWHKLIPVLSLTISGFVLYLVYLQVNYGDFLLFQKSMSVWKQSTFVFPLIVIYRYLKIFLHVNPFLLEYWIAVLELVSFFGYMTLSIYVLRKIRLSYGIFMIVLLLIVPTTGTLSSNPRYLLHLFPGFIALALLTNNHPKLKISLLLIFLALGFILTMLFTRGYFVA